MGAERGRREGGDTHLENQRTKTAHVDFPPFPTGSLSFYPADLAAAAAATAAMYPALAGKPPPSAAPQMVHQPQHQQLGPLELAELRSARARAAKAAESKRAQLLAVRRAKRAAQAAASPGGGGGEGMGAGEPSTAGASPAPSSLAGPIISEYQTDAELQAQLDATTDESEAKRLKRLLRNRVSAQQARERKRAAVSALEQRSIANAARAVAAEARVAALERECVMLRRVIANMRPGGGV